MLERLARIAAPGAGLGSPPPRRQVVVEGGRLRGDGRADDEVGRRPRREHAARHRLGAARESAPNGPGVSAAAAAEVGRVQDHSIELDQASTPAGLLGSGLRAFSLPVRDPFMREPNCFWLRI